MRPILLAALLLVGCRSAGLLEEGFTIDPQEDGSFLIRFESGQILSEEDLQRNLLWHAARAAIDRGATWVLVDGVDLERQFVAEGTRDQSEEFQPGRPSDPGVTTAPAPRPTTTAGISITRERVATARMRIFTERPPDTRAVEAMKLLDSVGP